MSQLLDPSIFSSLETKLEEETQIRDALSQILQRLERAVGAAQGLLTKVHSTPRASCESSSATYIFSTFFLFFSAANLSLKKINRPLTGRAARGRHQR